MWRLGDNLIQIEHREVKFRIWLRLGNQDFLKAPHFFLVFFLEICVVQKNYFKKHLIYLPQICFLGSSVLREKWGHESSV